ncbi:hypothetical protein HDU85_006792 [Gaertneriomyces sp. JEL0708]|nr:hypothetical protein HDU85_006792 [Gaertneriomyces sp. JEL0708]
MSWSAFSSQSRAENGAYRSNSGDSQRLTGSRTTFDNVPVQADRSTNITLLRSDLSKLSLDSYAEDAMLDFDASDGPSMLARPPQTMLLRRFSAPAVRQWETPTTEGFGAAALPRTPGALPRRLSFTSTYAGSPGYSSPRAHEATNALWVGNLPPAASDDEIWAHFNLVDIVKPASLTMCIPESPHGGRCPAGRQRISQHCVQWMPAAPKFQFEARYFILKSLTRDDLEIATARGWWATQAKNEPILEKAFKSTRDVYLIFSANKSGEFYGYARMESGIDPTNTESINWVPVAPLPPLDNEIGHGESHLRNDARGLNMNTELDDDGYLIAKWGTPFKIKWITIHPLPFSRVKHLRNAWNANKPIKVSRDGIEVETSIGKRLLQEFDSERHRSATENVAIRQFEETSDQYEGSATRRPLTHWTSMTDPFCDKTAGEVLPPLPIKSTRFARQVADDFDDDATRNATGLMTGPSRHKRRQNVGTENWWNLDLPLAPASGARDISSIWHDAELKPHQSRRSGPYRPESFQ